MEGTWTRERSGIASSPQLSSSVLSRPSENSGDSTGLRGWLGRQHKALRNAVAVRLCRNHYYMTKCEPGRVYGALSVVQRRKQGLVDFDDAA